MPKVLLLHTKRDYATSLADAVADLGTEYEIDVVAQEPIRDRVSHLLDRNYDMIQTDELMINGVLATGGSVFPGTPFVVSIRGWADYTNAHEQYNRLRDMSIWCRSKMVLRRASGVIFISQRTREEFTDRFPVDETTVAGRPIDVETYRSGSGETDTGFNLLTVTNLRYEKKFRGVKTILRGLKPVFERHERLRYSIAGDGRHLQALREFLREYPYADCIKILGFREDVPDLLAGADAFVYVSFLDSYATTVLEAQAAGLPVVAGDAVGVPEATGDGGDICPPTPEGIAAAIERLITDSEHRQKLAEKSERKMDDYNQQRAQGHLAVWDRVLGRS